MKNVLHFLLVAHFVHHVVNIPVSEHYEHHAFLQPEGAYKLYWNTDDDWITFEAHVATTGWVGLGLSPNGAMAGADIVVGGVKNGQPYLYDMHAAHNGRPVSDQQHNYQLLSAVENRTHTVIKLKRKLATCDNEDWRITEDTTRVIWAYHLQDANSETSFPKHTFGHYGSRSLMLLESSKERRDRVPPDVTTLDLTVHDVEVPYDHHTLYWCKMFKLPSRQKHHIIKYEPLIQRGNEGYLHHIVVYHCLYNMEEFVGKAEPCFNRENTEFAQMYKCTSRYLAGWAVGGKTVIWGENLGFPIFEENASPYYLLEVHYDNSNYHRNIRDSSGMRFYLTPTLRPVEVANLILGIGVSPHQMMIPPKQNKITLSTFCGPQCTGRFPASGINIVGGFLHEHLIGTAVRLRHIRNGVELPPILKDDWYDFNYQEQRNINPPRVVLPNDTLLVECEYHSMKRDNITFGGFTTKDEMCFVFVDYWPKTPDSMVSCFAGPLPVTFAYALGTRIAPGNESTRLNRQGQLVYDPHGKNVTMAEYAKTMEWDDGTTRNGEKVRTGKGERFQTRIDQGKYFMGCGGHDDSSDMAEITKLEEDMEEGKNKNIEKLKYDFVSDLDLPAPQEPYVEPDPCSPQQRQWGSEQQQIQRSSNQDQDGMTSQGHKAILDNQGNVILYWHVDPSDAESMVFEVYVRTHGWVGIGFSPNGGMTGADIMVGWVDSSGMVQIHDMYATSNGPPLLDQSQDYVLVGGMKNNTHTAIAFKRKLKTCDDKDWTLTDDTTRIIWAYGNSIPRSPTSLQKHMSMHRSSRSVHLMDEKQTDDGLDSSSHGNTVLMDFRAGNVPIPHDFHTLYWCQIFKTPDSRHIGKHHLIKYEPIIEDGHEPYVHHMILYSCSAKNMEKYVGKAEPCFDQNSENFTPMYQCTSTFIAGWAVGGETHVFPNNVGYPLFEDPSEKYFMLEMHYDNSDYHKNIVDNSGIRLHVTPNLQPIEAGTLTFGVPVGAMFQIIPPRQKVFVNYGYCNAGCTKQIPKDGVNVYAGLLHTHLVGKQVRIKHIRNGVEQKPLFQDNNYDFNYQEMRMLKQPVKIYPGDEFIVECVYDTSSKSETTFGGFSTREEMCLAYVEYFPRVPGLFRLCHSLPDPSASLGALGAEKVYGKEQMIENSRGDNVSVKDWVTENVDWGANDVRQRFGMAKKFQKIARDGQHYVLCLSKKSAEEMNEREARNEGISVEDEDGDMDKSQWNMEYIPQNGYPHITRPYSPPTTCARENDDAKQEVKQEAINPRNLAGSELLNSGAGHSNFILSFAGLVWFYSILLHVHV